MSAFTEDDVTAGLQAAVAKYGEDGGEWFDCEDFLRSILEAVAPQIAGRALREAADEIYVSDAYQIDQVVQWLRARADRLDGAE